VDASSRAVSPPARVAVAGATGYTGQELLRVLARPPAVTL
jgi:N-acetyl-gamma-glutamylphosphate reductase